MCAASREDILYTLLKIPRCKVGLKWIRPNDFKCRVYMITTRQHRMRDINMNYTRRLVFMIGINVDS